MVMVPEVCWRRPAIIIRSVDLPHPLGPTSTTKRPGLTSSETSSSATTSCDEVLKTCPTFLTSIAPARCGFELRHVRQWLHRVSTHLTSSLKVMAIAATITTPASNCFIWKFSPQLAI